MYGTRNHLSPTVAWIFQPYDSVGLSQATYIGKTGRNLKTRLTEHKRATKNGDVGNHISEHHRQSNCTQNRLGLYWMCHLQHKLPYKKIM